LFCFDVLTPIEWPLARIAQEHLKVVPHGVRSRVFRRRRGPTGTDELLLANMFGGGRESTLVKDSRSVNR
jgi:hypothetical protein